MKTLWNETGRIDRFLSRKMSRRQLAFFKLQIHKFPELSDKLEWQKHTLHLIKWSGRRKLKREIRQLESHLLSKDGDPLLKNQINQIWK